MATTASSSTPVMENVGHLKEFDPANSDWSIYKRRVSNYFVANSITSGTRKAAILLNVLSEDAYKLLYNLCVPVEPEKKSFDDLVSILSDYFKPSLTVFGARYKFYHAEMSATESPREWAARLKQLATFCEFEAIELEMVLRDTFIIKYAKGAVQDRLLEEKKSVSFKDVVEIAVAKSAARTFCSEEDVKVKKELDIQFACAKSRGTTQV